LLQETQVLFSEKARLKKLELKLEIKNDFPKLLMMDINRLKQIIFNLVGNAIKFTEKGYVRIMAGFEPSDEDHGQLEIAVVDTGIGIAEEQIEAIFEEFAQLSQRAGRKYEGTGLGLAIVRKLTEKMNGHIKVESHKGKGSVFTVVFPDIPFLDNNTGGHADNKALSEIVFSPAHIFVVDDVTSNLEMAEAFIESLGMTVSTAKSGDEAMEKLQKLRPDLILLDVRMPGISGYEVVQHIKKDLKTQDIPVLAYSATLPDPARNPLAKLFDGYLLKPVNKNSVIEAIKPHLKHYYKQNKAGRALKADSKTEPLLFEIPPEAIKRLPELIKHLKEILYPQWINIKDQLVLFRIEEFANKLNTVATEYNIPQLISYANRLIIYVNDFDLEEINMLLSAFPDMIKELEQINGKR
jgi:CheY-like chemotaxis protein/anti-sigma regulatory factor (Ser/Thr protein kinase)